MIMWIVLGSLIGVVIIFLVVTTTLDRRKNKKIVVEKKELSKKVDKSGTTVANGVSIIIKKNNKMLSVFVPSVGNSKMSDINSIARDGLKEIQQSSDYKLLKHVDGRKEVFDTNLLPLIKNKSNNWNKRNKTNLEFFLKYKTPVQSTVVNKDEKVSNNPKKRVTPKQMEKIVLKQRQKELKQNKKANKKGSK